MNVCKGCEHLFDYHVTSITGVVICVCTMFNSMKGDDIPCDCKGYHSKRTEYRREREDKAEKERERRMNNLIGDLKQNKIGVWDDDFPGALTAIPCV